MSRPRRDLHEDAADDDEEEQIQYGIRRSRRDVSFHYRDSSSLSPAQIMDQEINYQAAEDAMVQCVLLLQIILVALNEYYRFRAVVDRWYRFEGAISDAITTAYAKLQQMVGTLEKLLLILRVIKAYGEIALLYAEDLTVFIRRRNRFYPKRYRSLEEINRQDCYSWFGITNHDLGQLFVHWRIPETFTASSRHTFKGEECFIIYFFHLNKGTPFTEMARHTFGGDPRRLSTMSDIMVDHLYLTFYHKISGRSLGQWIPTHLDRCRALIHHALSGSAIEEVQYENGEEINRLLILHHFDFDSFRPFGFMDDFGIPTARPGNQAQRHNNFQHDIQRAFYSGYLRRHGLKAQVVYLPIGIIGSVFITELRQNDNGVQNISGINNYLMDLLLGIFVGHSGGNDDLHPALYCDGIFAVLPTILP